MPCSAVSSVSCCPGVRDSIPGQGRGTCICLLKVDYVVPPHKKKANVLFVHKTVVKLIFHRLNRSQSNHLIHNDHMRMHVC